MASPWVNRAKANDLPPSDRTGFVQAHGARAYDTLIDPETGEPARDCNGYDHIHMDTVRGASRTVASLAAALREDDAS